MELIVNYEATELKTNFEDVKKQVVAQVEKHSIDVTDENLKEAKQVMADLNKVKSGISAKYKQYIDTISQPINKLKLEKKELENIISDGRQKIADGVNVFESKKLEAIKETITVYKNEICESKEIDPNALTIDDIVKLTAVTANGTIAKATKEAIDLRIQAVENEILKAKIQAQEEAKRDREIAEQARQQAEEKAREREAQIRAKAEREKQEALKKAEEEKQRAIEEAKQEATPPKAPPKPTDDGKMIYTIQATFEVKAQSGLSDDVIINALNKKLQNAGITTCIDIRVL